MTAGITPREGDVVIERDKWAYVVRHVRHRESLTGDSWWDGTIIGGLITLVAGSVETIAGDTSKGWKVAVLCYPRSWWGGRLRVLLKERLPDGQDPEARVQELVDAVNCGEFDRPN
jgi:hypothetical protein